MTEAPAKIGLADPAHRPVDLVLARVHLRLGMLALARAELEVLAGVDALDGAGWVDLAEARWRSGDLAGAGEAATGVLADVGDEPIALVIAAEAAAALGRPSEARRLATRAMTVIDGPVDVIFAGMPRSTIWPADATEPPPIAATLFQQEPAPAHARRAGDSDDLLAAALRTSPADGTPAGGASRSPVTPGFWDVDGAGAETSVELPDPVEELEAARQALVAGASEEASLRFALTLRLAPALAPAVIEATEGGMGPALNLVRGDAFRLVGLETEARRAYTAAAWSGARDRRRTADEPEAPPASDTIPRVQRSRRQGKQGKHAGQ